MGISAKQHWENIYSSRQEDQLSWFQEHALTSLALIQQTRVAHDAAILDVGGGASVLADDLLHAGYCNLTVLDLSPAALRKSQARLGAQAQQVRWLAADIAEADLAENSLDIWHDRAVFHFLTEAHERGRYLAQALKALKPHGFLIIAVFAEDGPLQCSGLDIQRFSLEQLQAFFAPPDFALLQSMKETHMTPAGKAQNFQYAVFQKRAS